MTDVVAVSYMCIYIYIHESEKRENLLLGYHPGNYPSEGLLQSRVAAETNSS